MLKYRKEIRSRFFLCSVCCTSIKVRHWAGRNAQHRSNATGTQQCDVGHQDSLYVTHDYADQKFVDLNRSAIHAVVTTAGNRTLTGEYMGEFLVLDSRDGKLLSQFQTGGQVGAGIAT